MEEVIKLYLERATQLHRVSSALRIKGAELCADQIEPLIGAQWADQKSLPEEYWETAERLFGIGDDLRVLNVLPNLPADNAGIKPGDKIARIDDTEILIGQNIFNRISKASQAQEILRKTSTRPVIFEVDRQGELLKLAVRPTNGCSSSTILVNDDRINASADGKLIRINTGMLRFLKDDDELAIVIGHELAHNILEHVNKSRGASTVGYALGLILDIAAAAGGVNTGGVFSSLGARAGQAMFSKDHESESDYLGLYFAARAGFNVSKAPDLWRRMAAEYPSAIKDSFLATHPTTPERAATLEAAVREVRAKIDSQAPLVPAKRETQAIIADNADKKTD